MTHRKLKLIAGAMLLAGSSLRADAAPPARLKLDRIVMLMRHGIRPPTKVQPIPPELSDKPWPNWPVDPGLLTPRGAQGVALLGAADRHYLIANGLLPAKGCPAPGVVSITASGKQRAIKTAESWSNALLPGCHLTVAHPADESDDPIFHGLDDDESTFDGHRAWQEAMAMAPKGGLEAERQAYAPDIALLEKVLGCHAPACDLEHMPFTLTEKPHGRPDLTGAFDIGSTASQTFLLEYLEGMPMSQVGWGRITRPEIEQLLRFHPVKFKYSNRPPFIARATAKLMVERITGALRPSGPQGRITLLAGHDTNIADLGSLLGLHWRIASYPVDDTPPGGALGFELWKDAKGGKFVRAFYRAQTMDQLRQMQPIDGRDGPIRQYLDIPGCGDAAAPRSCSLSAFETLVRQRLQP